MASAPAPAEETRGGRFVRERVVDLGSVECLRFTLGSLLSSSSGEALNLPPTNARMMPTAIAIFFGLIHAAFIIVIMLKLIRIGKNIEMGLGIEMYHPRRWIP